MRVTENTRRPVAKISKNSLQLDTFLFLFHRFILNGWDGAQALEMNQVYHSLISPPEIQRIEKIEFLDEKELLDQLFHHYCICVAWKDSLDLNLNLLTID